MTVATQTSKSTRPAPAPPLPIEGRTCSVCDRGKAAYPERVGPASHCRECWSARLERYRNGYPPLKIRTLHRNALAAEYELRQDTRPVGRLILLRDSMTMCVRFFSLLSADSELVLEEALNELVGNSSREYLNVITYSVAPLSGEVA